MGRRILALFLMLALCGGWPAHARDADPDETVEWTVLVWGIPVGKGFVKIWNGVPFEDKQVTRLKVAGETTGIFALLYHVKDSMESYCDPETLLPYTFEVDFKEGGYKRKAKYIFKDGATVLTRGEEEQRLDGPTHDVLSAVLKWRSVDLTQDTESSIWVTDGQQVHRVVAKVTGTDRVRGVKGKEVCAVVEPDLSKIRLGGMLNGHSFSRFRVWVTLNEGRVPVQAEGNLPMFSILANLHKYKRD